MTIKDKVEEVIAIADPVSDRVIELIKESKKTLLVISIIAFIIWLI